MKPTVTMFDISPLMLEMCRVHGTASVDLETRPNHREDESAALDFTRGHVSLVTVKQPVTEYTEVVRMRVRGTERDSAKQYPDNLSKLIEETRILKIFHHALFDLRFLHAGYGMCATTVVCTKLLEKILRPGSQEEGFYSLSGLAKRYLNIDMPKGYALSDWETPELTPEQIRYAAEDVAHLDTIFAKQYVTLGHATERSDAAHKVMHSLSALAVLEAGYGAEDIFSY